jgi:hypothetical protein
MADGRGNGLLFALKREYAAWIPKSVALKLEPFENAIHKIGVASHLIEQLRGDRDETRTTALNDAYQLFSDVMGLDRIKESDAELKEEIAVENVKEEVRSILGINELFEIRSFIIGRSVEFTRRCT